MYFHSFHHLIALWNCRNHLNFFWKETVAFCCEFADYRVVKSSGIPAITIDLHFSL